MRKFLNRIFGTVLQVPEDRRPGFQTMEKTVLVRQLNSLMEQRQPYLIENYSLRDLAGEMNIQQHQLSVLLNREIGMNFNNYLNQHRVQYCKTLIEEGVARSLNIKGLASKCGFHNRNTLTTAFKRFTGCTPSDYSKQYFNNSAVAD